MNRVICGDTRNELKQIPTQFINLVYLDPPFFSQRKYEMINEDRVCHFNDKWQGGMQSYLEFMNEILDECYRILVKSGSLYLQCDSHASHYLKIVLDKIFGYNNFRNEIIWKRHNAHNDTKQGAKHFGRIHDVILFYTKSNNYTWNTWYQPYSESYVDKFYRFLEPETRRRYALGDLSGPGGRSKGNPSYEFLGVRRYWRFSKQNMTKLYKEGRIIQTRKGAVPKLKRYLDEMSGIILQDVWDDIISEQFRRKEHSVYPTQKPIKLMERIIDISSNPDDVVLDPMCGSGSTLVAARNLGRKWIGIDVDPVACDIAKIRVRERTTNTNNKLMTRTLTKRSFRNVV